MKALSISKLVKTYPTGAQALKGINLEIPKGARTAIVGPSGCGKTTAAKLLLRLHEMIDVQVRVANRVNEIADLQPRHVCHHMRQKGVGGDIKGDT